MKVSKTTLKVVERFCRMRERLASKFAHLANGRVINLEIVDAPKGSMQPGGTFDFENVVYVWINDTNKYLAITYEGAEK